MRIDEMISREDEAKLARAMEGGDGRARERLIVQFLPLVHRTLRDTFPAVAAAEHEPWFRDDMLQEGREGLVRAADRFRVALGYRFQTYAVWWIRARMYVEMSRHRGGAFSIGQSFYVSKVMRKSGAVRAMAAAGRDEAEIAQCLGLNRETVAALMPIILHAPLSLDAPLSAAHDGRPIIETVSDERHGEAEDRIHREQMIDKMQEVIGGLGAREGHVFTARMLRRLTLREIGEHLGISRERVRQLEARARRTVRRRMAAAGAVP